MRILLAAAAFAATAVAAPASADHHMDDGALAAVLADERRADDRARDEYRHPAETLAFFRVEPGHKVAEYAPGGGWYTRVLAPYLDRGNYTALTFGPGGRVPERYGSGAAQTVADFPGKVEEQTGVPAAQVGSYITAEAPEDLDDTFDRVLIIRMMHNLMRWGVADTELMRIRELLKDDGMVGIVQHEAPEGMAWGMTNGNRGYLQKSDVIALMELYGFELVDESFVNANPADTADHPSGVWTLPPSLARGDEDREKYLAIGESNRMTLLFRKAE